MRNLDWIKLWLNIDGLIEWLRDSIKVRRCHYRNRSFRSFYQQTILIIKQKCSILVRLADYLIKKNEFLFNL